MLLSKNSYLRKQRYSSLNRRKSKSRLFQYLMLVLPLILLWGYKEIKSQLEPPQAILVLGGSTKREKFAAQFARKHPDIPIWVSGGTPKDYAEGVFTDAGIDLSRLHLDYRAVDTVTNFTTLVDEFQSQGINKIYLITSDYHMRRARVIGSIVLGSRGMEFQPVPVPSERSPEPVEKVLRDGARALLWLTTGRTGASLPSLGNREP
ncbi:YdcF family protein [Gloeocapsa sp. PCC 7428]|uniref:YdcF family protein n=1 Tax=Gloeocapsa sp. PCC 7428 TaxID=1173026 RepID=UPI0018C8C310|nr:YdcF family protein [Gloeocapsa sp. PCC 7428]